MSGGTQGKDLATKGASMAMGNPTAAGALGVGCIVGGVLILFLGVIGIGIFGQNSGSSLGQTTGDGSLRNVGEIPESLKVVFEQAGAEYSVSSAFIAAIFWKEHGETWPTEGPWASSPKGANGPFQFIEKTWEGWSCGTYDGVFESDPSKICPAGYGQDGDFDGKADVQNLFDSSFAASELLGANGAAPYTTDLDVLRDVASRYNSGKPWSQGQSIPETADYVPAVIEAYTRLLLQM